jgi:hypothetical protein
MTVFLVPVPLAHAAKIPGAYANRLRLCEGKSGFFPQLKPRRRCASWRDDEIFTIRAALGSTLLRSPGRRRPLAIELDRVHAIRVLCGLRQAVEIGRKARLGAERRKSGLMPAQCWQKGSRLLSFFLQEICLAL